MEKELSTNEEKIVKNEAEEKRELGIVNATFEEAISATGFGKFNLILLMLSIPCGWATMMDTTAMSYVVPAAHCDLNLTLEQRGMLNAITFLGMISGALIWGFLADTLGRKKILITGYLLDSICEIIAALSQSYQMLITTKFFTGLIMNGPYAALTTTVSEFHSAKYRGKVVMVLGVIYSVGQMVIPGLGWLIIPRNIDYEFLDGNIKIHSWNVFMLICSIPSITAFVGHCFLPESPKFLMTVGRNEEALRTFKKVYSFNTGRDPDTFLIKSLVDETKLNTGGKHGGAVTANRSKTQALKEGWQQIAPMFFPPYIWKLLLSAGIQFCIILGINTIRLWLPQIFTAMNDYQLLYPNATEGLCTMLEIITPNDGGNTTQSQECVVNVLSDSVYINSMIVGATSIVIGSIISAAINVLGKKRSLLTLSGTTVLTTICFYLAQNSATVIALSAITVTFLNASFNIELAIAVDMFPTTLRTIAVAITMMIGRIGASTGNVVFPYLLAIGCLPPFLVVGCIILTGTIMSVFLPKTDLKAMT
ncbi:synaptic vesicle glycoprotein 2 [Holotrichia oblita]|uniref:Synaptic vesicle glycoprotein 2 n=1 Tax=Holotrichia oblita TaxID=644536 RepID=A0ACB9SQE6_HOLOL|nr:synaptic vesicle glycoprotein 2 [Holotrichia oblita]